MQTFHVEIQFVSRAQIINNEFLNFYKAFKCFNICKCPGCRLVLASVLFSEPTHCLRSQWSELKWPFSLNRNFTSSFQNFAPTCNSPRMLVLSSAQKQTLLDQQNAYRNQVATGQLPRFSTARKMAKVRWNDQLAFIAELNTKQCEMVSLRQRIVILWTNNAFFCRDTMSVATLVSFLWLFVWT